MGGRIWISTGPVVEQRLVGRGQLRESSEDSIVSCTVRSTGPMRRTAATRNHSQYVHIPMPTKRQQRTTKMGPAFPTSQSAAFSTRRKHLLTQPAGLKRGGMMIC